MPRCLLREPHLLASELRAPLTVLVGWLSMIRDGDIAPEKTPQGWRSAMNACQEAASQLNLIINQACDEAGRVRLSDGDEDRIAVLLQATTTAIDQSRRLLHELEGARRGRVRRQTTVAAGMAGPVEEGDPA